MYIIKNCDAIYKHPVGHWNCANGIECQRHEGCLMKQIVKRCKDSMDYHSKDMYILGKTNMAGIVLALLQIEEVE